MRGSRSIISTFVALFFLVVMACINPPARGSEVGNTHVFGVTQLTANVWNAQSEGQSDSNLLQPVLRNLCAPCCPDWHQYAIVDFLFLQRDNATSGAVITEENIGGQQVPIFTTRSMQPATAPGVRLFYGELGPDCIGGPAGGHFKKKPGF